MTYPIPFYHLFVIILFIGLNEKLISKVRLDWGLDLKTTLDIILESSFFMFQGGWVGLPLLLFFVWFYLRVFMKSYESDVGTWLGYDFCFRSLMWGGEKGTYPIWPSINEITHVFSWKLGFVSQMPVYYFIWG